MRWTYVYLGLACMWNLSVVGFSCKAYSWTQEELGSIDTKPRCIWVQLVCWTQVWLGSVVCWIHVYMGLACMLNPSVVGFSFRLNPKGVGHRDVMTRLGVGRECIVAQLGVWVCRKHNPILGYDVRVMTFKWGVFTKPSISMLSFHYLFYYYYCHNKAITPLTLSLWYSFFYYCNEFYATKLPHSIIFTHLFY